MDDYGIAIEPRNAWRAMRREMEAAAPRSLYRSDRSNSHTSGAAAGTYESCSRYCWGVLPFEADCIHWLADEAFISTHYDHGPDRTPC